MLLPSIFVLLFSIVSTMTATVPNQSDQLQEVLQNMLTPLFHEASSQSQQQVLKLLQQLQADLQLLHAGYNQLHIGQLGLASALQLHNSAVPSEQDALLARLDSSIYRSGSQMKGEPKCVQHPTPQPTDNAPHQEPLIRACARSCLQLRNQSPSSKDGVYWLMDLPVPVFCDMSHDGGGWTLLLTAVSKQGWDVLAALERNELSPSLADNYAILKYADGIKELGNGTRFAYRIETQAETGRSQWGGVWLAPRSYSFVHGDSSQQNVFMVRRFNKWNYQASGVEKRMPWLNYAAQSNHPAILTTMSTGDWWGTLVTHEWEKNFHHSPWISPESPRSGTVLYWLREEAA